METYIIGYLTIQLSTDSRGHINNPIIIFPWLLVSVDQLYGNERVKIEVYTKMSKRWEYAPTYSSLSIHSDTPKTLYLCLSREESNQQRMGDCNLSGSPTGLPNMKDNSCCATGDSYRL